MGTGPWMHRGDVVEGWLQSLTQRWGERVEHWIETESGDPLALRNNRPDERSANAREQGPQETPRALQS